VSEDISGEPGAVENISSEKEQREWRATEAKMTNGGELTPARSVKKRRRLFAKRLTGKEKGLKFTGGPVSQVRLKKQERLQKRA